MKPDRQHPLYLPFATALRDKLRGGYNLSKLRADLLAGVTVGIVATPLTMALAISSGAPPQYGLYTAIVAGLLIALTPFLSQHLPLTRFGPANQITLIRAGIAALIAGLAGGITLEPILAGWMAGLAGVALLLDGLDGWLARRGGTV